MYCKLTDQKMQTHNGFQWELNRWVKTDGKHRLCTDSWLHCYNHPLLAVLLNPIHANISNPRLFKINVKGKKRTDNGLKFGFTNIKLIRELELPEITREQRIAFGILCAKEICSEKQWNEWADNWLNNKDRTEKAAYAITYTGKDAPAAYTAMYVVNTAIGTCTTGQVVDNAAAVAAEAVAYAANTIDLIKLAKKALTF